MRSIDFLILKFKIMNKLLTLCPISFFLILVFNIACNKYQEITIATYDQILSYRNIGLAKIEDELFSDAVKAFTELTKLAPQEAAGYANLGWSYLQSPGKLDSAEIMLLRATELSPENSDIQYLIAKMYELTGRTNKSREVLVDLLSTNSKHILSLYQLSEYNKRSSDNNDKKEAQKLLKNILQIIPGNIAAHLKFIELSIKNGDTEDALLSIQSVNQILPSLPDEAIPLSNNALQYLRNNNLQQALVQALMFHNLLKSTTYYKSGIEELRGNPGPISGKPLYRFTNLKPPDMTIKEKALISIKFVDITENIGLGNISQVSTFDIADYDGDGAQDMFISQWKGNNNNTKQSILYNQNGALEAVNDNSGIRHNGRDIKSVTADYDNDGFLDLLIINNEESKLYKNDGRGKFNDMTNASGLSLPVNTMKAGFFDYDLEGDLDLFVVTSKKNQLYRNNGDGNFTNVSKKSTMSETSNPSVDIAFGDFDDDGDGDIFIVNMNGLNRYYNNRRQGYFNNITNMTGLDFAGSPSSVEIADYNNDGLLDLFLPDLAGAKHTIYKNNNNGGFEIDNQALSQIDELNGFAGIESKFFDVDNDGFLDLLIAGSPTSKDKYSSGLLLLHNNGEGGFSNISSILPINTGLIEKIKIEDIDNDGDQDIILLNDRGDIQVYRNDGGNINNYLKVRLAGLRTGSSKNNYFGFGSKLEIKSDGLYQMRSVNKPITHFGLGNKDEADIVRVVWSNGVPQNQYSAKKNQTIVETQVLKGSCPYLYTWDGTKFVFATDVLWPSALGMPLGIMAGEPLFAFPNSTDELLSFSGDKLLPNNGKYLLKFTSELWETPYLDRINLVALDHPDSVDLYINETFSPPPFPPKRIYRVAQKHLPLSAVDNKGNDLKQSLLKQDLQYTSHLIADKYQGITELHDLILNFGDFNDVDSMFLFLQGWLFPTDASINVNISQSTKTNLIFPSIEAVNQNGKWETIVGNIGFPKGKNKTIVVDLTDKFLSSDYRLRIRTNMQIYWDHIFISTDVSNENVKIVTIEPNSALLQYRGFSIVNRKNFSSPHIPDYYNITTGQKWRDLTGAYTKYGDVLPLLLESDSKYVIMNAGDEISLEFLTSDLPSVPNGWRRDFLFYNDGWLKDGDLNTANGQTVNLLPFHGMSKYPYDNNEAYPNSKEFTDYRKNYNTRVVTTGSFKNAIRNYSKASNP